MITGIALQHKDVFEEDLWKTELLKAIKDPFKLLKILELSEEKYQNRIYQPERFKLFVTRSYVDKIEKGNWNDPLLKQVLPLMDEIRTVAGFNNDPVGDLNSELSSGVIKKYQGRVLLITTGACAVHCRYCFRQAFPYGESIANKKYWRKTIKLLKSDESIKEVILSGGDPLMLSDSLLKTICFEIANIPHVTTIRFHTRVPIFLPERINAKFVKWTRALKIQKVLVLHSNHANELDDPLLKQAMLNLDKVGFTLLNQSVLLKDINDNVDVLSDLSEKLFSMKILPYYLHQLDRVQGAAHFEVEKTCAISIIESLKSVLPGYLVPKLVEEVSGERSKQAVV